MKKLFKLSLLSLSFLFFTAFTQTHKTKTVAIVVPLEYQAMAEIVTGFKEELSKKYLGRVKIVVKNAHHDSSLARSIISQYQSQHVDVIVPIGTSTLEMALSFVKNIPIVGIAAETTQFSAEMLQKKDATTVVDELDNFLSLKFMQEIIPNLKKITLVHSADSKAVGEAKAVKKCAKSINIDVELLMVQQISDLYSITRQINSNSQAIFLLKDSLVVSGIATLTQQAESLQIPLISSDDGSVQNGAGYALGVKESDIGKVGAEVVADVLNGKHAGDIKKRYLTEYRIFLNRIHAKKQRLDITSITELAKQKNYHVQVE